MTTVEQTVVAAQRMAFSDSPVSQDDVERLEMIVKNLLESAFAVLPGAEVTLQITPEYITESGIQLSFAIVYSDQGTSQPSAMAGTESSARTVLAGVGLTEAGLRESLTAVRGSRRVYISSGCPMAV